MSVEFAFFVDSQRHIHTTRIGGKEMVSLYFFYAPAMSMTFQVDASHSHDFIGNLQALALQIL